MRRLVVLLVAALLGSAGAGAADREAARAEIGRPVQQAEQLLKQKKFTEALAKLDQADRVAAKTPYERYVIAATRAAVLNESGDYPGAIAALEAALATGVLPRNEELSRLEALASLSYRARDYARLAAFAERYYAAGGKDEAPRLMLAQAYYLQRDFPAAARTSRQAIAEDEHAGRPSPEALLQILADSEYQQQHLAPYRDALRQLVERYPKREYWSRLIAAVGREPGFADRLALELMRVRAATGTLETPAQYTDAAELALQASLPAEAQSLLERGFAAGVFGQGAEAGRAERLLALARQQAAAEMQGLAQRSRDAEAAPSGEVSRKLGDTYASEGRWAEAIGAFQRALEKGGLRHPEDAKLRLGVACLEAGRSAKAREILHGVAGEDGTRDLAQLWLLVEQPEPPLRR